VARARRSTADWELGLIDAGLVLLLFVLPHRIAGDAVVRFDTLGRLLDHGQLTGSPYSYVGPLFSAPLYYLGKLTGDPAWWCQYYNTLLLACGFAGTTFFLRNPDERAILRPFYLIVLTASMFPNHVTNFNAEPFTAVTMMVGVAAITAGREAIGWSLAVLAVVNTPAALVGLLFMSMDRVVRRRSLKPLLAVAGAGLLIALESWVRRGSPFITGYEGNSGAKTILPYSGLPGFSYPFFFGVLSIVFSFGKGIVFYAPGLLLRIRRDDAGLPPRLCECCRSWLLFLAGLVVVYAKWWAWYGGLTWGPRFFLIASLPASLAIALRLRQAFTLKAASLLTTMAAFTLSLWVGIDGAVFGQANLGICQENYWAQEFLCWYVPEFSALWRPFVAPSPVSPQGLLFMAFCLVVFVTLSFDAWRHVQL
jgi:hypothetical protein